jgi:hypothetical protein
MIKSLLALALLTVVDPVTGPVGAGDLVPPTAAVYRNLAAFDLQEITVADAPDVQLEVQLGSFSNPYGLPLGFSHPVIDIYLGGGEHGVAELLPGHGMRLPEGELWSAAFRLTGDAARGYQVLPDGSVQEFLPAVELVADRLFVSADIPAIRSPRLAALVGLYDPFQETGWRPLAAQPNAWAFSSSEQVFPVLDVLAIDEAAQVASLLSGILPVTEASTPGEPKTLWLLLMASGIALAGAGLLLRMRAGRLAPVAYTFTEAVVVATGVVDRPEQTRGASPSEIEAARKRLLAGTDVAADVDEDVDADPEADVAADVDADVNADVEAAGETPTVAAAVPVADDDPVTEVGLPAIEPVADDIFSFPDERQSFEIDWEQDTWLEEEPGDAGDHYESGRVHQPEAEDDSIAGSGEDVSG